MILYEPDNPWSVLISPVLQMGKLISEIWGSLFKVMQKARGKAGICSGQHGTRSHFFNHYTRLPPVWLLFLQVFAFLLQNTSIFPVCSPFFDWQRKLKDYGVCADHHPPVSIFSNELHFHDCNLFFYEIHLYCCSSHWRALWYLVTTWEFSLGFLVHTFFYLSKISIIPWPSKDFPLTFRT